MSSQPNRDARPDAVVALGATGTETTIRRGATIEATRCVRGLRASACSDVLSELLRVEHRSPPTYARTIDVAIERSTPAWSVPFAVKA